MGKQQKLKEERKSIERRAAMLKRINLPFPKDLAQHPQGRQMIDMYTDIAGVFVDSLTDGITPIGLRQSVRATHQYLDNLLDRIPRTVNFSNEGLSTIDCRAGCNYCCTLRVTTNAPSILALAHYLQKNLGPDELAVLLQKIEAHCAVGLLLEPLDQVLMRRMCPLNEDGVCAAYQGRPMGCRYYHSFDVGKCREDMESATREVMVPMDPERRFVRDMVARAFSATIEALGLDDTELEFIPALRIALTESNVAERYLRGEPVFASAHRPEVIEAQARDMASRGLIPLPQAMK